MATSLSVYEHHDHKHCIKQALSNAQSVCSERGVRFTKIRQRVFELIWQSHTPVGAYDLLPQLEQEGFNSAPPTVYRALDFLLELGLVHRINSLNAYIGCTSPHLKHESCFFICRSCGKAQELEQDTLQQFCRTIESELGVQVARSTTELTGTCPQCQQY